MLKKTLLLAFTIFVTVIFYSCKTTKNELAAQNNNWGKNPVWDDGLAEVAVYNAKRVQYGKTVEFDAVLITVKEDFNKKFWAKADSPYDNKELLGILKLNTVLKYETPNYPYSYLISTFVERENPMKLAKQTVGSQEWCGNSFTDLRNENGKFTLYYNTYWDSEGKGEKKLGTPENFLVEDQIPLSFRSLPFKEGFSQKGAILPTLAKNKLGKNTEIHYYTLKVVSSEKIGEINCWKVEIEFADQTGTYFFEKEFPNILVSSKTSDGREFLLKQRERRTYWN
ncbi:hypothetical protein IT568_03825 [bacterium]|nr:hypothetical protein [bacterium]